MLNGKELGAAIRSALKENGKKPADAAAFFDIKPPSVSGWMSTGRISKDNFHKLVMWLEKTPPSHWGMDEFRLPPPKKAEKTISIAPAPEKDAHWPFEFVDQALYRRLTQKQQIEAQVRMNDGIKAALAETAAQEKQSKSA